MDAPSPPNDPQVEAGVAGMTASFAVPTTAVANDVATAAIAAYERTGALGRVAISTCVPATPPTATEAPGSFAAPTASFAVPTAGAATEVANAAIAAIERSGVAHMGAISTYVPATLSTYVPATPPGPGVQESSRFAPEPVLTTSPETACAARHVCLEYLKGGTNRTAERVFNTSVLKDIDDSVVSMERMASHSASRRRQAFCLGSLTRATRCWAGSVRCVADTNSAPVPNQVISHGWRPSNARPRMQSTGCGLV